MVLTYCELSTDQRKKLFEYFVMEVTACSAANVMGIYANSTAPFYHKWRKITACMIADDLPFDGKIELDKNYFGGVRKGFKCGHWASGKPPVFGLLNQAGKVHVVPVPDKLENYYGEYD